MKYYLLCQVLLFAIACCFKLKRTNVIKRPSIALKAIDENLFVELFTMAAAAGFFVLDYRFRTEIEKTVNITNYNIQDSTKSMNQNILDSNKLMNQQIQESTKSMNQQIQESNKLMNQQIQESTKSMNQQIQESTKSMNQQIQESNKLMIKQIQDLGKESNSKIDALTDLVIQMSRSQDQTNKYVRLLMDKAMTDDPLIARQFVNVSKLF